MSTPYDALLSAQAASTKPLPKTDDPLSAPFWVAARENKLVLQQCQLCGYVRWPAASTCPECLADGFQWIDLSGQGRVWSYCTYERAVHPVFANDTPYVVAGIQLEEGPFLFSTIVNSPSDLKIGQPVEALFEHVTDDVALVKFRVLK